MKLVAALLALAVLGLVAWKLIASRTHEPDPPSNVVPRVHEAWAPSTGAPRSQPIFDRFATCMGYAKDIENMAPCACEGDLVRSHQPPAQNACADYMAKRRETAALSPEDQVHAFNPPAAADVVIPTMSVIMFMRSCERAGEASHERTARCACRVDYFLEHMDERTFSTNSQMIAAIDSQVAASDRYCQ
jgi:hypothetical protein